MSAAEMSAMRAAQARAAHEAAEKRRFANEHRLETRRRNKWLKEQEEIRPAAKKRAESIYGEYKKEIDLNVSLGCTSCRVEDQVYLWDNKGSSLPTDDAVKSMAKDIVRERLMSEGYTLEDHNSHSFVKYDRWGDEESGEGHQYLEISWGGKK